MRLRLACLQLVVSAKRRKVWSSDNCTPLAKARPVRRTWVVPVGGSYLSSLPVASASSRIRKWFLLGRATAGERKRRRRRRV